MWYKRKMQETMLIDIDVSGFSSLIFKVNEVWSSLKKRATPQKKFAIVREELDSVDVDGIGSLEDLHRLVLINEECGNL